jgi:hypothetical protein
MITQYLDEQDQAIVQTEFAKLDPDDLENLGYAHFWNFYEVSLDGTFALVELKAFVNAMELMEKRHETDMIKERRWIQPNHNE